LRARGDVHTDIGQVRSELEAVDNLGRRLRIALDAKGEDTAEGILATEQLLRECVRGMRGETEVGDPRNMFILFKPLREGESVVTVPLSTEAKGL